MLLQCDEDVKTTVGHRLKINSITFSLMKVTSDLLAQKTLLDAIKNNDALAMERLYTSNYHKVQSFVLKNSGSIAEARDLYQESFLAMYENVVLDKFEPKNETALQGYLYSIARHKWLDVLRSNQKSKTVHLGLEPREESFMEDPRENDERLTLMKRCFTGLGDSCRAILESFYFKRYALREIAVRENITEASARNKKYRCMEQLKKIIENSSI